MSNCHKSFQGGEGPLFSVSNFDMIMDWPLIVQNIIFYDLEPGCPVLFIFLFFLCPWSTQWTVLLRPKENIMVEDIEKHKDGSNE